MTKEQMATALAEMVEEHGFNGVLFALSKHAISLSEDIGNPRSVAWADLGDQIAEVGEWAGKQPSYEL